MPGERGEGPAPRLLVVVAHPDDETVGAGALLGRLTPIAVLHATDGAPRDLRWAPAANGSREAYARTRRRELEAAMALAGVPVERLESLRIADQEAVLALPDLTRELVAQFTEIGPDLVLIPAYEGGHPDHDAVAFAAHAAAELLRRQGRVGPELVEMTLYHAREGRMVVGEFLLPQRPLTPRPPLPYSPPSPGRGGAPAQILRCAQDELPLTPEDAARKTRMLEAFASQRQTLQPFLPPGPERFRLAPTYRFTEPPHPGPLQYEIWGFPLTGEAWRAAARRALRDLGLPEEASF